MIDDLFSPRQARDHFLGFSAVSGRGETFKSGGRVVKNVTGYDLCKLMAGSWGTLAAMTDVTIKVLPRSETEVFIDADIAEAGVALQVLDPLRRQQQKLFDFGIVGLP